MTWAIRCDGVSKCFRLGNTHRTLTEVINRYVRRGFLWKRDDSHQLQTDLPKSEDSGRILAAHQYVDAPGGCFWALRNVQFEVEEGQRVGIIGKNGSGKSTLLKILSRIVAPTTGELRYRGRLISLLEIGTGFHPELTGRENIFLNGSIMGMTPREIKRKLDDIIEFSELGAMIDTPIKRYSSGMYVRLAFSVAAHLESEILVVDEVLAVGDAAFQKKCLEKMLELSHSGRTLLFVSHDMGAVNRVCSTALELSHGEVVHRTPRAGNDQRISGAVEDVTRRYLENL